MRVGHALPGTPSVTGERIFEYLGAVGRRPIYVESRIRAPIERVWSVTQDPLSHARWDVRFGEITYLPSSDGGPQRFTYSTRVLPGVTIAGTGESLGDRSRPDGTRWSGLRFWADDQRSIIEAGAGYWRYIPTEDGVRFLTRYDYRPRWGRFGEALDRWLFRPVFGWATAWSFDRLRLWLEEEIPPERSRNRALARTLAVAGVLVALAGLVLVPPGRRCDPRGGPALSLDPPISVVSWRSGESGADVGLVEPRPVVGVASSDRCSEFSG
jgi:hypothetical protein